MNACAVVDIGKTNQKVLAFDRAGRCLGMRRARIEPRDGPPYRHQDTEAVWAFVLDALAHLAGAAGVEAVAVSAYGSTAALIDDERLVLPIADYEHEPPSALVADYDGQAPPFDQAFAPTNPGGLTLGRQLHWLKRAHPDAVARARHLLLHPQYWTWRLSGVAAAEVTSLGAQTHLWNPLSRTLSPLAAREGWATLLPPLRPAWDVLGPITAEVAAATGLPAETPVLCGIHDSNANFLRYRAGMTGSATLMSTGTWLIAFNPDCRPEDLDPARDTNTNTDMFGQAVPCGRFMLGREFALAGGGDAPLDRADVEAVVAAGTLLLPSFTDSGGPVPGSGGRGRATGPAATDDRTRAAAALLYVALMSSLTLDAIGSRGPIVIDGGFAATPFYPDLIAALRPGQPVSVSREAEGSAAGAALLWGWPDRPVPRPDLCPVAPPGIDGLAAYAARWRAAIG